ncbi:MAG: recombinase family protein [Lachnospiraceae bacterium]|nr:recombinase family protein [Lachnospiraceae bacterium]
MKQEMKTLRAGCLYIRVSTHMQEELSPDAQKRLLLDYAKANNIVISNEYIFLEGGISGKKADRRPEFMRMISIAKQKPSPFDVILVWKFSRFARNQEESIVYKSLLRKQCNVDVVSVSEPIIDGPFGSLIERIIEWMDEYYSVRLSGEVFRGMTEKALKGGYQARPPLGYRIDRRGEPPVIVPEEARTVRLIFDKYVQERMGMFDIARHLNTLGLRTSRGKAFECRSIEYIIQNPTYCGMIRWNRTENETNRIKDKNDWIVTQGVHEPIISTELFDQAQQIWKQTYHPRGARPSSTYRHWLSGIVKCPACGRTMIAKKFKEKSTGKEYCYFTCYGYAKGKCPSKTSVSSRKIEPIVLNGIQEATRCEDLAFEIKQKETAEEIDERALLEEQLAKIADKEDRIKEAYRNGIDTLEEYKENKELLVQERKSLETRIAACVPFVTEVDNSRMIMSERISGVYDILSSDSFNAVQKSTAVKSIISKIIYRKEEDTADIFYFLS